MSSPVQTPNSATTTRPERSSRRVAHKRPLGWLPWALLGLLALIAAGVFLAINAVDDDGPDGPAGDTLGQVNSGGSGINGADGNGQVAGTEEDTAAGTGTQPTAGTGTEPTAGTGTQPTAGTGTTGGGAGAGGAALRVGGSTDLLGLAGGSLAGVAGQSVQGTARVESVVSDEGFWVGSSRTDRVFVYLTERARQTAGESGFQVRAGQTVQLTGEVVGLADNAQAAAGVTDAEGRDQLTAQGGLVQAETVELAS